MSNKKTLWDKLNPFKKKNETLEGYGSIYPVSNWGVKQEEEKK